jgi:hypothetical protein
LIFSKSKVITLFSVQPAVALPAQGLKIALIVRPAVGQFTPVMDERSGCEFALGHAYLTKRMRREESRAHLFPCSSVTLIAGRVAVVVIVSFGLGFCVFLAIAFACQIRTTWIGAGLLWLIRHRCPPFLYCFAIFPKTKRAAKGSLFRKNI